MAEIDTLLLDLDDTIVREAQYLSGVVQKFVSQIGFRSDSVDMVLAEIPRIRRERVDVLGSILSDLGLMSSANHDALFEIFCCHDMALDPVEGAQDLFDMAEERDWKVVVLTNGVPEAQSAKWRGLRIAGSERAVFMPARLYGGDKPNVAAFDAAIAVAGTDWSTVLAVGDKYENDLAVPRSRGARTFLVKDDGSGAGSLAGEVGTLVELVISIRRGVENG